MSEPIPVQPASSSPSSFKLPKYAWPVILVVIAAASFVVGQRLAPAPEPTIIENESPVTDASEVPLPDGKGGEPVETDVGPFVTVEAKDIRWEPITNQPKVATPAEVKRQLDAYFLANAPAWTGCGPGGWGTGPGGEVRECADAISDTTFAAARLARIVGGEFSGNDLVRIEWKHPMEGLFGEELVRFMAFVQGGDVIVLSDASGAFTPSETLRVRRDVKFAELEAAPESLSIAGMTFKRYAEGAFEGWGGMAVATDPAVVSSFGRGTSVVNGIDISPLRALPANSPYTGAYKELFYFLYPNGEPVWYKQEFPFLTPTADGYGFEAAVTWKDGSSGANIFREGQIGGCGMSSPISVLSAEDVGKMVVVGSVLIDGKSEPVYSPAVLPDWLGSEFQGWKLYGSGKDLEEVEQTEARFLATHPVFIWRDAFGRLLEFRNIDAIPAAECGKPVIYLYPEETTDVSVKVDPKGGFTYTDPEYGTGWEVVAQPDGALTNKADGKAYPYLFWEGRGGLYQSPEKYWVVAKADVPSFITSTLSRLGLNEQEVADFNEFWLPRMEAAPYYKVGFHGTQVMDQLAPLSISPAPDSIIRVLMDYEELSAPIPANPPTLPRPFARDGFTVVEWGGVIR